MSFIGGFTGSMVCMFLFLPRDKPTPLENVAKSVETIIKTKRLEKEVKEQQDAYKSWLYHPHQGGK